MSNDYISAKSTIGQRLIEFFLLAKFLIIVNLYLFYFNSYKHKLIMNKNDKNKILKILKFKKCKFTWTKKNKKIL